MKSWWKSNTAITQISPIDVSVDIVRAVKKTVKNGLNGQERWNKQV